MAQAKLDGTYDVLTIESAGKAPVRPDPKTTPPGQSRHFVVQGKQCAIFDLMVGFQGTLVQKKGEVSVTWYEGPAGKLKKKETMRFSISADGKTLTQISGRKVDRLVFVRVSDKPLI